MKLRFIKISIISILVIFPILSFAQNLNVYYSQGVMYFNVGNYKMAEEYLKKALTLDPSLENTSNIKTLIGLSALYSGDMVTARAYLPENFLTTAKGTSIENTTNLINQIAHWESNPLLSSYQSNTKPKSLSIVEIFLIFILLFASMATLATLYIIFRRKKNIIKASSLKVEENEENVEDEMKDILIGNEQKALSYDTNIISDEEIEERLKKALNADKEKAEEKKTVIVQEPDKVIKQVSQDPSEEELAALAQAIQEILSKDSEKSDK
ncbi:tetratricopeptide repeat protein [Athalassotoga saccharophila]|uniref:tetratricopeptide repeat protein n=1 Tax=Athalassotoga saccharophila TaxID=1441386 RepID=UPI00137AD77E|nr:tetratricopeptide repeat protein [Athalassotoga saccharophila]BBJ27259.1 TPR repeat-containing protein [Athalassotoga saccharophila]